MPLLLDLHQSKVGVLFDIFSQRIFFQVPRLIQRHANEVRILKEQLRKQRDHSLKLERTIKEKDAQTSQTKKHLHKYKKIVESKNLGEREDLSNKLSSKESQLDESNKRVRASGFRFQSLSK